jgi:hypothetical protein
MPESESSQLPETPDPPPPQKFTLRGGCVGAVLVYGISLLLIVATVVPSMYRGRLGWKSLDTPETMAIVKIAILLSFVSAAIGFFAGREGAKRKTVNAAFLWGGILCGLATLVSLPLLFFTYFRFLKIYTAGFYIVCALFIAIITASGSLVSGLAAIVVRDRRDFGRTRLIPQFTLQEIFIVFTIVSVIISSLATAFALRL